MTKFRVLIDSRRKINSGIGRVSQWLSENLVFNDQDVKIINLTAEGHNNTDYVFHENSVVTTDIKPFSCEEYYELPKLVASINPDLYINPQTTWSPLHKVASINIIHDLWAIKKPEWLPTESDLKARFGIGGTEHFDSLSQWMDEERAGKLLTQYGYNEWLKARRDGNRIWLSCWAQYAAIVSKSKKCVVVSDYIKSEVERYFRFGINANVIYNIPKPFDDHSLHKQDGSHFLTLSKLENRKNLDFLLDSYMEYCNRATTSIPLIIAGDAGYIGVAEKFLKRISAMQTSGYAIVFKKSVDDRELKSLFSKSCALIFPTHFESFGLPALEGMLSGIPVIATKTGMMATYLGQHASLISGDDVVELAGIMIKAQKRELDVCTIKAESAVQHFISECDSLNKWQELIKEVRDELVLPGSRVAGALSPHST